MGRLLSRRYRYETEPEPVTRVHTIDTTIPQKGTSAGFLHQVAMTFIARAIVGGSGFVGGIIVARYLGADGVGIIAAIAVMNLLAVNICGFGLPSSITYLVARQPADSKRITGVAILYATLGGSLAALLLIGAAVLRPGLFGTVPPELVMIAAWAVPFQMLLQFSQAVLLGQRRIASYNLLDVISQSFLVINPLLVLAVLALGLRQLVSVNIAMAAIVGISAAMTVKLAGSNRRGPASRGPVLRRMVGHGARFFIAMAASLIVLRADLLIVNYFRGTAEAGVYGVSTQVGMLLLMVPNVISTVLFPKLAGERDDYGEITCRITRHATLILLVLCMFAAPLAFLLPRIYGEAFSDVPWQVLILLPGVFLIGIESIQVQYFSGLGLPKAIPAFWIFVLAGNLFLNVGFVPRFGAFAAAAVSTLSYGAMLALVTSYFCRRTGRSLREIFVIRPEELTDLFARRVFVR